MLTKASCLSVLASPFLPLRSCLSNSRRYFQTNTAPAANQPFAAFQINDVGRAGRATCEGAFGLDDYSGPDTKWTNTNYGARDMASANITMVNGNMDPWHALSIVNASSRFHDVCVGRNGERAPAGSSGSFCPAQRVTESEAIVFIDGTAHCGDMYVKESL